MNLPGTSLVAPPAPLSRGAVTAIGLGVAVDGALTLVLPATGWTQGGAHIAGWLAGSMFWLLLAAWAGRGGPAGVLPWAARVGWRGVLAVLALGLRGGVLASALAWGLPAPAAALLALAAAWAVLIVGERQGLARIAALPAARRAPAAAGALALAMVLLHLAYLKVFPLLPRRPITGTTPRAPRWATWTTRRWWPGSSPRPRRWPAMGRRWCACPRSSAAR